MNQQILKESGPGGKWAEPKSKRLTRRNNSRFLMNYNNNVKKSQEQGTSQCFKPSIDLDLPAFNEAAANEIMKNINSDVLPVLSDNVLEYLDRIESKENDPDFKVIDVNPGKENDSCFKGPFEENLKRCQSDIVTEFRTNGTDSDGTIRLRRSTRQRRQTTFYSLENYEFDFSKMCKTFINWIRGVQSLTPKKTPLEDPK